MIPTGTFSFSRRRYANQRATAENIPTDSSVAYIHLASNSLCCADDTDFGTVIIRREEGSVLSAQNSRYCCGEEERVNSILDCPEASQTSPTITSRTTARSRPEAVSATSSYGPPTGSSGRRTRNSPVEEDAPYADTPAHVIFTTDSGSVVPQTGTGIPR